MTDEQPTPNAEREALIRMGMDGWVSPQELSPLHQHLMFFCRLLDEARADYANLLNDTNGEIGQLRAESASRLAALNDTRERAAVEVAHLRDLQDDLMAQNKRAFDRNVELEREVARLTDACPECGGTCPAPGYAVTHTLNCARLTAPPGASRWRHKKRGTTYQEIGVASVQAPNDWPLHEGHRAAVAPGASAMDRVEQVFTEHTRQIMEMGRQHTMADQRIPLGQLFARTIEQAEREATKAAHAATAPGWEALGTALRMIRDAVEELAPVGGVPSRDVGPPNPVGDAEDIIEGIKAVREQAEREARAAAIEEACAAICYGCEYGWERGFHPIHDPEHKMLMHKDPQTGKFGDGCDAFALRALSADNKKPAGAG